MAAVLPALGETFHAIIGTERHERVLTSQDHARNWDSFGVHSIKVGAGPSALVGNGLSNLFYLLQGHPQECAFKVALHELGGSPAERVSILGSGRSMNSLALPVLDSSARCWIFVDQGGLPVVVPVTGEAGDAKPSVAVTGEAPGDAVKAPEFLPSLLTPTITPDNRFVVLPLPNQQQIRVFPLSSSVPKVDTVPSFTLDLPDRAAPETLIFHPMRKWAYGVSESSVTTFAHKDGRGELELIASQDLPSQVTALRSSVRKLLIHPEGTFLYALAGDAIFIFSCRAQDHGRLVLLGRAALETGLRPTDIAMDSDGNWLIAAFKENNLVRLFHIQKNQGGGLVATGKDLKVESPRCLLLMKTEQCCGQ